MTVESAPSPRARSLRTIFALLAAATLTALGVQACSSDTDEQQATPSNELFGYAVDVPLETTNAGSSLGASIDAQALSTRLYPGPFTQGPKGQWIPNRDVAEGHLLPGVQQRAEFKINEQAKFSDGASLTCDSFLLAFRAGTMPSLFHSYMPLMNEVESVECQPNSRSVDVVFKQGFGPRWRQIFPAGTLLPAHAIAREAGLSMEELNTALSNQQWGMLEGVAQVWNEGYELENFNASLQQSLGPYKIRSVGDQGEVILERNEYYAGAQAEEPELVVWPRGSDLEQLRKDGVLRVADSTSLNDLSWLDRDDVERPVEVAAMEGVMTDSLLLSDTGVFATAENRKAFAACIDQAAVAQASEKASGVPVTPVVTRMLRAGDPSATQLKDITDPHLGTNIDQAKALGGTTINIGYSGPDQRKADMVKAIQKSCAPAGIEIVDASKQGGTFDQLQWVGTDGTGAYHANATLDALLLAVDPVSDFSGAAKSSADIEGLRKDEAASWDNLTTVPLATQPRVQMYDRNVLHVVPNTNASGVGWNMDRWSTKQP
ncbi:ABC transporter substrate-binding protein [Corynebacterium pseudopelargi]|uniref:Bacterial extracellular solute-binding proteins, family 5 Middle n=1 Tax=Corynebacterium pseudopelargi TaxID=2080757 RepID=A0A3G6IYE5_9CORY|nr:ABC transporter substrate-binding protein [Corynebacterium pseudopelargi]AZA09160.1 Bacterial extracellular solute-binding proteins, family 5 Middle [Corynebacterium pseudopelargi]